MGPGHTTGGGHYVSLVGISGKMIEVYDPNHDNTKYGTDGLIDQGVKNNGEARQYWIITSPIKEEDLPMTKEEKQAYEALLSKVDEQSSVIGILTMRIKAPEEVVQHRSGL
jgi:hypothetical protein